MSWRPLNVVNIFLGCLEWKERCRSVLGVPKLYSPVHTATQNQVTHLYVTFWLASAWMDVDSCDCRPVSLQYLLNVILRFWVQVALVDVEVLCSYKEFIGLAFWKLKTVSCSAWFVLASASRYAALRYWRTHGGLGHLIFHRLRNFQREKVYCLVSKHFGFPLAQPSIVTDADDVVSILGSHNGQTVDWMSVTVLC